MPFLLHNFWQAMNDDVKETADAEAEYSSDYGQANNRFGDH